jgi:hypothetical protein
MTKSIVIAAIWLLAGCAAREAEPVQQSGPAAQRAPMRWAAQELEQTHGAHPLMQRMDLCRVTKGLSDAAGIYRVEKITSYMEEDAGRVSPRTYVELALVSPWRPKTPKAPVIRMEGGVQKSGSVGGFPVTFVVGETVGVVLSPPSPENLGFHRIHPLGLFRADEDVSGYSNGMHFRGEHRALADIGTAIARADAARTGACPVGEPATPELAPAAPFAKPDQVLVGTRTLDSVD